MKNMKRELNILLHCQALHSSQKQRDQQPSQRPRDEANKNR